MTVTRTAPLGFAELTLETDDLPALRAFYAGTLGLAVTREEDDRVWLAVADDARLGLWCPGEKEHGDRGGRHVHFAFQSDPAGLDRLRERLSAAGHEARLTEHDGGDRSLYVEDPAGNVVEIWDHPRPGRVPAEG